MILLIVIILNWIITIFGLFLIHQILVYLRNKAPGQKTLLDDVYVQFLEYYAVCIMPVLGMISHKKSLITIFGHKHFRQNLH